MRSGFIRLMGIWTPKGGPDFEDEAKVAMPADPDENRAFSPELTLPPE
jgi:hypothetical protein